MSEKITISFSITPKRIKQAILLVICVSVILGVIFTFATDGTSMVRKTAVITEDTPIYMDPDLSTEFSQGLKKGDLVNVVYHHGDDVFYVLDAATTLPFAEGYLSGDKFTYDFDRANQGILGTNTVFSEKDNQKPAGYVVEKGRTPCIIHSYEEDGWVSISLPGDINDLWVKEDRIIYDLNFDLMETEDNGHYNIVKKYMEEEYCSVYDKYYDNNYIRYLNGYDEVFDQNTNTLTAEFILSGMSKNKYKSPEKLGYLKEAKESSESVIDQIYYEGLFREYNMYKTSDLRLKLTAQVENGKLVKKSVKLYSDMGVGANADWKELEKGLKDFIIG